jgi:hypothetical protein
LSVNCTLPSATIDASAAPVNALVIEPMRIMMSPSGARPEPFDISPYPRTTVSPLRMAPMTSPGGFTPREIKVPVKSTISARSASSAWARGAEHTIANANTRPVPRTQLRTRSK